MTFASAIARDNLVATQFHPEKSGEAGLRLYHNFLTACADSDEQRDDDGVDIELPFFRVHMRGGGGVRFGQR